MKNLANCTPREFLVQTNKIRKFAAQWLSLTKILEIRKHTPVLPKDAKTEDKKKALEKQAMKNLSDMLDAILDEHPEETAELLGMLFFVEPEDLDNHSISEFLAGFSEIISDKNVLGFFTSLMSLGTQHISDTAKA